MKSLLLVIITSLLATSCASLMSPSSQEIVVTNEALNANISIGKDFKEKGEIVTYTAEKDFFPEQIIVEVDGYKPDYSCAVLKNSSPLYYLTWAIPFVTSYIAYTKIMDYIESEEGNEEEGEDDKFMVTLVWGYGALSAWYLPGYDNWANRWSYKDTINTNKLLKYPKWDKSQKRIFLDNVSLDLEKGANNYYKYKYDEYKDSKENPYYENEGDSLGYSNTVFEENVGEILRKYDYLDTNNTVFVDNINTLVVNTKIYDISINEIGKVFSGKRYTVLFYQVDIKAEWMFTDVYGDTLYIDTLEQSSGEFSLEYYCKNFDEDFKIYTDISKAIIPAIGDAIEISMINFLASPKAKELIKIEYPKTDFESLTIQKPTKTTNNIQSAMQATVTIKQGKSHGSGFFISNDGYIITNYHVIHDTGDYTVITQDGKKYKAKIIRSNPAYDLALIKIEGEFEYAYSIPENENYMLGDNIFAVGTPKDIQLGQSVSKGIISNSRKFKDYTYIQSDVSVNAGNSGGPVISKDGALISVVEFKLIGFGTEGISFSIPATVIKSALNIKL